MAEIEFMETSSRIEFTLAVGFVDGTEKHFTIRDDGWKVWIYNESGFVDSMVFESNRVANKTDAFFQLREWAHKRYAN